MEKQIKFLEKEIADLKQDMMVVKNHVSSSAIQYQILVREASIKELKTK